MLIRTFFPCSGILRKHSKGQVPIIDLSKFLFIQGARQRFQVQGGRQDQGQGGKLQRLHHGVEEAGEG